MSTGRTFESPEQRRAALDLCSEMPVLADRLMRAGLHKTANAFREGAMQQIGWEVAEIAERTDRAAREVPA